MPDLVKAVRALPNVRVRGLMTVAPHLPEAEGARPFFASLRAMAEANGLAELSMVMTHYLEQAVEVVRDALSIPVRVIINRDGVGDDGVENYCGREGIPVLMRIPFDRRIAMALSEGTPLVKALPEYAIAFSSVLTILESEVAA